MNCSQRSSEPELLDLGPSNYTLEEYVHCQSMLFRANRLLGVFRDTVHLLKPLAKTTSLLDVGCGGGLFLLHLSQYFPAMQLTGIDIAPDAIAVAKKAQQVQGNKQVRFEWQSQPQLAWPENSVDVLLATMVCHHLTDIELVDFLQRAQRTARHLVILHDLQRHALAHWVFKWFSPWVFKNKIITHDGLISIRRSFTRVEWVRLLKLAGITNYQLSWRFPFRWQIVFRGTK